MTIGTLKLDQHQTTMSYTAAISTTLYSGMIALLSMPLEKWGVLIGIAATIFTAWVNWRDKMHAAQMRERELQLRERELTQTAAEKTPD